MHDDLIERRLRDALRSGGESLAFTITSAELERRLALRRRHAFRPTGLLLAAAVGIGLVGVASLVGGWFDRVTVPPAPLPATAPVIAVEASPSLLASPPAGTAPVLPTLDAMLAAVDPSTVVLAQSHGPDGGPLALPTSIHVDPPRVQLELPVALPPGHGDYEATFACISSGRMGYFVKDPARFGVLVMPDTPCDGSITTKTFLDQGTFLELVAQAPQASWRVVVRRISPAPGPIDGVTDPPVDPGQEEFVRTTDADLAGSSSAGAATPGASVVPVRIVSLPARVGYNLSLSCQGAPLMRIVFGDDSTSPPVADTYTGVFCDGVVHRHELTIAHPNGTSVYVTPTAGMTWQLVVSSDAPPIELVDHEPGWQLSSGLGPSFRFDDETQGVSLFAHDKPGPVRVAVTCAGDATAVAHVSVQNGTPSTAPRSSFDVDCPADGGEASRTYDLPHPNVDLTYSVPPGTWIAVSALVPDPATAP